MDGPIGRVACVAGLLACAACATPTLTSSASEVAERFPFLRGGETRLREVIDRLGAPAYRHEADGVRIWIAEDDGYGQIRVPDEQPAAAAAAPRPLRFSELVLEFDASEAYVRGSLVRAE